MKDGMLTLWQREPQFPPLVGQPPQTDPRLVPEEPGWAWGDRHWAQSITTGLLLGPCGAARDLKELRRLGVTHILVVRSVQEKRFVREFFPGDFSYKTVEVEAEGTDEFQDVLEKTNRFIHHAIENELGVVLVHGNSGVARSAAIVAGYLIHEFDMCAAEAALFVAARRQCTTVNQSLQRQLDEYRVRRISDVWRKRGYDVDIRTAKSEVPEGERSSNGLFFY